jgi:predicted acetyltransferase
MSTRTARACAPTMTWTALGLRTVLVTCGDSNLASARVIEKAGGVLEDVRDTELGLTRRYWITV